jgi:hypothetical protein
LDKLIEAKIEIEHDFERKNSEDTVKKDRIIKLEEEINTLQNEVCCWLDFLKKI